MIYDISPPIDAALKVWPGDTPMGREVLSDMGRGGNYTLSTLRSTVHLGAHADAPSHYAAGAPAIHERSLDYYLGPCQVIRTKVPRGGLVGRASFTVPISAERILFHTGTFPDPSIFNEDFAALEPELIDWLQDKGVRLVGIDTPSADPFSSKELPAHNRVLKHDMALLEGVVLKDVPDGVYELIALPLKLVGFDASPVRAVLRTRSEP